MSNYVLVIRISMSNRHHIYIYINVYVYVIQYQLNNAIIHIHTHTKRTNRFSFVNLQACRCLFVVSNPTLYYETDMILSQRLRTCMWPMGLSKMDETSSQQKSKAVESSSLSPTETRFPRFVFVGTFGNHVLFLQKSSWRKRKKAATRKASSGRFSVHQFSDNSEKPFQPGNLGPAMQLEIFENSVEKRGHGSWVICFLKTVIPFKFVSFF